MHGTRLNPRCGTWLVGLSLAADNTLIRRSAVSMLAMDTESLERDAEAGKDQFEAAGTSAVGREDVNSRLLCSRDMLHHMVDQTSDTLQQMQKAAATQLCGMHLSAVASQLAWT